MTDKEYNCYDYAKELGFTEAEARDIAATKTGKGQDATVMRRLARAKGLIPADVPAGQKRIAKERAVSALSTITTEPKKHKHSYRKDGTCKCGQVRRERKAKA